MTHSPARTRALALALLGGIALAVGTAGSASAADPTGPVTFSNLTVTQSASVLSVDFDYVADVADPGTFTLIIQNSTGCTTTAPDQTVIIPAIAPGHYSDTFSLPTNNRTQISLYRSDGTPTPLFGSYGMTQDPSVPTTLAATIVPDADATTGQVQFTSGYEAWATEYSIEVDGVPTDPGAVYIYGCVPTSVPYSGLAVGSTIEAFELQGESGILASFTRSAAPAFTAAAPADVDTLALTGTESGPWAMGGGALLAAGLAIALIMRRKARLTATDTARSTV